MLYLLQYGYRSYVNSYLSNNLVMRIFIENIWLSYSYFFSHSFLFSWSFFPHPHPPWDVIVVFSIQF